MASSGQDTRTAAASRRATGSTTGQLRPPRAAAPAAATMFGDLPDATRLAMEAIVRRAATPEQALPLVIDLLVPGSVERHDSIVAAIETNDGLREQWERTWQVLRR